MFEGQLNIVSDVESLPMSATFASGSCNSVVTDELPLVVFGKFLLVDLHINSCERMRFFSCSAVA